MRPESRQGDGAAFASMTDVFRRRAAGEPGRWCYSFLRDGDDDEERVSYGEVRAQER